MNGIRGQWWSTVKPSTVAFLVAVLALGWVYAPGWWSNVWGPGGGAKPVFPSTIAPYSWFTGMLSHDRFPAASLLYQNGVGVEFLDTPQSVLLGTDGSTYRRLDVAESLSIPEDQGDPAVSVLSPDGTFVVVGSAGRTGDVQVVTLRDGHRARVPIGDKRTALPISVGADRRTVLLAISDQVVNRYADADHGLVLARLDLPSGRVELFPGVTGVDGAALSPDGSRIVAMSDRGVELMDAATGRVTATVARPRELSLDGDAWSPDGRRVALVEGSDLVIIDVSGPRPAQRRLPLRDLEYASAIGWRDEATVLVHGVTDTYANTSELYWVDSTNGEQTSFASYTPNFTGASLLGADAARDLVPRWQVEERPVNRGPLPLPIGLVLALTAGLLAAGLARGLGKARAKRFTRVGPT